MDKYHIYEEIGKGVFSQVFKGREKKKIEYVAIKRVEKSMMNKIVAEVQVMHKLESPHTLRFHDWYETRNNLWLILEYCTGADLASLLKQDGHLPESSVRMFGLDMLAGLKYMHMQGLLHCDLRPCNFLVDEYGILKICDFKQTRKLPKQPLGDASLEQRGTPPYMAPELFRADGVHSFTSDFWALGTVFYELRRGFPPFGEVTTGGLTLEELIANISRAEPVESPPPLAIPAGKAIPSMSAKLADLLAWMLDKTPACRCTWADLSVHPFWGPNSNPSPASLPPEPAFEFLVRNMADARSQQLEKDLMEEFGLQSLEPQADITRAAHKEEEEYRQHSRLPIHVSDSTPIRPAAKSGPSIEQQTASKLVEGRTAAAATAASESKSHDHAVLIAMAESKVGASHSSSAAEALSESKTAVVGRVVVTSSSAGSRVAQLPPQPPDGVAREKASTIINSGAAPVVGSESATDRSGIDLKGLLDCATLQTAVTVEGLLLHSSDTQVKPIVGNKAIEAVERLPFKASALPFSYLDNQEVGRLSAAELEAHLTLVYKSLQRANAEATKPGNSSATTQNALYAERSLVLAYLCAIVPIAEVANIVLNTNFLQLLLRLVAPKSEASGAGSSLSRTTTHSSARGGQGGSAVAAGAAAGSGTTATSAASTALRVAAATVLATTLRYATFVQPPTAKNRDDHLLPVLVGLLRDSALTGARIDAKLKRRAVAALGETLFYVSSQEGEGSADKWNVPSTAIGVLLRCLKDDSDEVVRHYAAKTIENILAQGHIDFRRRLTNIETACRLLELSQHGRNEALQASCAMALSHMFMLVMTTEPLSSSGWAGPTAQAPQTATGTTRVSGRSSPAPSATTPPSPGPGEASIGGAGGRFMARVLERAGGLPAILETLLDGQPKLQQAYLNILCLLFASPARLASGAVGGANDKSQSQSQVLANEPGTPSRGSAATAAATAASADAALRSARQYFLKASTLAPSLLRLVEQGGTCAVRAKAILLAQLLCTHQPTLLVTLAERRLPAALARLLEPLAASHGLVGRDGQSQAQVQGQGQGQGQVSSAAATTSAAYPSSAALSMVQFVLSSCAHSCRAIATQLVLVQQSQSQSQGGSAPSSGSQATSQLLPSTPRSGSRAGSSGHRSNAATPDARELGSPSGRSHTRGTAGSETGSASAVRQQSASTTARRRLDQGASAAPAGYGLDDGDSTPRAKGAGVLELPLLLSAAESLLAAVSIASQPLLRRLIAGTGSRLVVALAEVLRALPAARSAAAAAATTTATTMASGGGGGDETKAVIRAEQAALAALETLSQLDLAPPMLAGPTGSTAGTSSAVDAFLCSSATQLLPAAAALVSHPDGDVRVVVASALRRMAPACLRALAAASTSTSAGASNGSLGSSSSASNSFGTPARGSAANAVGGYGYGEALAQCLEGLLDRAPQLLSDQPPIPQYAVRMLSEAALGSGSGSGAGAALGSQRLTMLLAQGLHARGVLPQLVANLRTQGLHCDPYADAASDEREQAEATEQDPQLALLLRCLFERGGASVWLLEADIAGALARAVQIAVQRVSSVRCGFSDQVTPLVELLHVVLHFVIRSLSTPPPKAALADGGGAPSPGPLSEQTPAAAQQYRRLVASLRVLCPSLFHILSTAHQELEATFDEGAANAASSSPSGPIETDASSVSPQLQDTVSRCLGILFDLFPDAVLEFLLLQSPGQGRGNGQMGQGQGQGQGHNGYPSDGSPREVLAAILCLQTMDLRLRVRLLKILAGVVNMAPALGAVPRVRELLLSQPLNSALQNCARLRKQGDSDVALFNKLAKQLLDQTAD